MILLEETQTIRKNTYKQNLRCLRTNTFQQVLQNTRYFRLLAIIDFKVNNQLMVHATHLPSFKMS